MRPKDGFQVPMGQMVYRERGWARAGARAGARLWGGHKGCGCRKCRHSWSRRDCSEGEPGREERLFWQQSGRWSHCGKGRGGAGLYAMHLDRGGIWKERSRYRSRWDLGLRVFRKKKFRAQKGTGIQGSRAVVSSL